LEGGGSSSVGTNCEGFWIFLFFSDPLSYKPAGHPVPHLHAGIFPFFWRNLRTSWLVLAEPFVNRQSMNQEDQIQMVVL
jgi:hypothetical protein